MQELILNLSRADSGLFWLCAGGAGLFAVGGLWQLIGGLRGAARALAEPTSAVRSAAQGHVVIEGRGRQLPGEPVRAPLSTRRCLWWRYTIFEKGRGGWQPIERRTSERLFALEDDSGSCLIDPAGADVGAAQRLRWHGRQPMPAGRFGIPALFARYRYEEELLKERAELRATGLLRTQRAADGGHFDETEEMRALLEDWKLDQQKLMRRSDADRSAPAALGKWETQRRAALQALHDDQIERGVTPGLHVLSKPVDGRPLILSATPLHRIVARHRWRAFCGFLMLVGGSVLGFWLLLARTVLPAS